MGIKCTPVKPWVAIIHLTLALILTVPSLYVLLDRVFYTDEDNRLLERGRIHCATPQSGFELGPLAYTILTLTMRGHHSLAYNAVD